MARDGAEKIDAYAVDAYLRESFPFKHSIFTKHQGIKYMQEASATASLENFNSNYIEVRKWSLIRNLVRSGIDVTEYYDPDETDLELVEYRAERFKEDSIDEIINFYRNKILGLNNLFSSKQGRDSVKAGSKEAEAQKEAWKEAIDYGLSYASNYLNTVTYGIRKKRFTVMSAGTGTGKTRISIANICHSFAPMYWDVNEEKWMDNPNGTQNCALYIGTEMELIEEIEPIIWAYMAHVPEDHITMNTYEDGEEERVDEAIRILREKGNIYLEYIPDYDIATLEAVIEEHVSTHHVTSVFFDYIHTTTDLISEYQGAAKSKMSLREDQVLGNLSSKLKELTRKYNISIDTWTQVTGDFKNESNRDQTIVRGAKSIIDKCDVAAIVSRPTVKELQKLEKILKSTSQFGKNKPNVCMSVYKNRGGKYNNVKIWLDIDYSTMRIGDLFVTDYEYEILPIEQNYVHVTEDNKVHVFTDKESARRFKYEAMNEMADIADDSEYYENPEELSEEDRKRLSYHMSSTATTGILDKMTDIDEDDFDY